MNKIKLSVFVAVMFFINGCAAHNANNDVAYKKAVIKLVKKEKKEVSISKNIVEYNKASK